MKLVSYLVDCYECVELYFSFLYDPPTSRYRLHPSSI
jgi:hypothetical protein